MRAAQYLRTSTDKQDAALAIQAERISLYAAEHGLEIVRNFVDRGCSGLSIAGRPGFQALLRVVMAGVADFQVLLVHDVSRWGRFQDMDEAAHVEWLIRKAGIAVRYCAEPFADDISLVGGLLKAVKRAIAGEYARELSAKVFAGQARLASRGFWTCGEAPYGTRRMIVDAQGKPRMLAQTGERKSIQSDRVVLVPGPAAETGAVRLAFGMAARGMTQQAIADHLNEQGIVSRVGRPWTRYGIATLLANPAYVGKLVYNRTSKRLRGPQRTNDRDAWVAHEGRLVPLIAPSQFDAVRLIRSRKHRRWSREAVIDCLADLLAKEGYLSAPLINSCYDAPAPKTCQILFGSLWVLYLELGYVPPMIANVARPGLRSGELSRATTRVADAIAAVGGHAQQQMPGALIVNAQYRLAVRTIDTSLRLRGREWRRPERAGDPPSDMVIEVRQGARDPIHYFLPTGSLSRAGHQPVEERGQSKLGRYRLETLADLYRRIDLTSGAG